MTRYLARKTLLYLLTFFVAVTIDWAIPRLMPGNPVDVYVDFLINQLRQSGEQIKDTENILLQKFAQFEEAVTVADSLTPPALNYAVTFRLTPQAISGTSRPFILDGSLLT